MVPVISSILSASVLLPWSMCAMMLKFLIFFSDYLSMNYLSIFVENMPSLTEDPSPNFDFHIVAWQAKPLFETNLCSLSMLIKITGL